MSEFPILVPIFPTPLHQQVADVVQEYFSALPGVDTILVVNSCARGKGVPESDLDFAVLVRPGISSEEIAEMEVAWNEHATAHSHVSRYRQSGPYAHLHLDLIDGNYLPQIRETGGGIDYFEVEVGNQVAYSAPLGDVGRHYQSLRQQWLPYFGESLRRVRWISAYEACRYDLHHIPAYVRRELYFQAFDLLYRAFQTYLQTLFIAHATYPIAYNKWIREQVAEMLQKPELYAQLPGILSIADLAGNSLIEKAKELESLLQEVAPPI